MKPITYVICKHDLERKFQFFWYGSIIYSKCEYCGVDTSYTGHNYFDHYYVYQYKAKRYYNGVYDVALVEIKKNPEKYLIVNEEQIIL